MDCRDRWYFDGVRQIHFLGGMIRFDCGEYTLGFKDGVPATPDMKPSELVLLKTKTITMPPQGFLAMLKSMEDLATKLADAGILSKKDVTEAIGRDVTDIKPAVSNTSTDQQETK